MIFLTRDFCGAGLVAASVVLEFEIALGLCGVEFKVLPQLCGSAPGAGVEFKFAPEFCTWTLDAGAEFSGAEPEAELCGSEFVLPFKTPSFARLASSYPSCTSRISVIKFLSLR